jgi:hypothetical protein
VPVFRAIDLSVEIDVIQTLSSLHEDIYFFLLVRRYLKAYMGHTTAFKGRGKVSYKTENLRLLVRCSQKYDVVLLEFGMEVISGR